MPVQSTPEVTMANAIATVEDGVIVIRIRPKAIGPSKSGKTTMYAQGSDKLPYGDKVMTISLNVYAK